MESSVQSSGSPAARPQILRGLLVAIFAGITALVIRLPALRTDALWGTTEQQEFGLFPSHVVSGLIEPTASYLPQAHQGCTVLFGVACAPIVSWLGPTLEATRLCSTFLHVAICIVIALLALRGGGLLAGFAGAALAAAAPPGLQHYATKGSTNHDDATLFVGLTLLFLTCGRSGDRASQLRWAAAAGLAGGIGVLYYLDAAFALAGVLAVGGIVGGAGWRTRLAGVGVGGTAALASGVALGVRPWASDAIRQAFARSPIAAEQGPTLVERASTILGEWPNLALGFPGDLSFLKLSLSVGEGGAALYSVVLLATGLLGLAANRRDPDRSRLIPLASAAAIALTIAALIGSGVGLDSPNSLPPAWTYLVVFAAAAMPASGPARWVHLAGLCFALWLSLGAGVAGPALSWATGTGASVEASLANRLTVARLATHQIARKHIVDRPSASLRSLLDERPDERDDLLRILGWQTILRPGPETMPGALPPIHPGADEASAGGRPWYWQGVGEGVTMRLVIASQNGTSEDQLPEVVRSIAAFETPIEAADRSDRDAFWAGLLQELLWHSNGRFADLEPLVGRLDIRPSLCRAAGRWAYVARRPAHLVEWNAASRACSEEELGMGWAEAMAWDVVDPDRPLASTPQLRWFWAGASHSAQAAFRCTLAAELAFMARMESIDWRSGPGSSDAVLACLPAGQDSTPKARALEVEPTRPSYPPPP